MASAQPASALADWSPSAKEAQEAWQRRPPVPEEALWPASSAQDWESKGLNPALHGKMAFPVSLRRSRALARRCALARRWPCAADGRSRRRLGAARQLPEALPPHRGAPPRLARPAQGRPPPMAPPSGSRPSLQARRRARAPLLGLALGSLLFQERSRLERKPFPTASLCFTSGRPKLCPAGGPSASLTAGAG